VLNSAFFLLPPGGAVDRLRPSGDHLVRGMHATSPSAAGPLCGQPSARLHRHYSRRLADLPWQGRTVDLRARGRRFRCTTITRARRIFAEGLAAVTLSKARRTGRLHNMQQSLGLAPGGAPGCRLADKLAGTCEVIAATTAGRRWKVPASRHGAQLWTGLPREAMGRAKHEDVARERIAAQRDRHQGRQTVHPPPDPKGSASKIDRHRPDQHPDPGGSVIMTGSGSPREPGAGRSCRRCR
jgi:hypothetical protein